MPGNPNANYFSAPVKTAQQLAAERYQAQIDALPKDIQAKIASGELLPNFGSMEVDAPHGGTRSVSNGVITGFSSPGPNDTSFSYDAINLTS